ncbi:MAG TPA: hypothetical protein VE974_13120 [Thermoanaerobaculia bacterium]|nr:hypothetical protein [Thermoanaerobaculia bacterium]
MLLTSLILAATLHAGPELAVSEPLPNASPYRQFVGEIAASDDVALIAWLEEDHVAAARVDRDGRPLDARPIALSSGPAYTRPSVARGTNEWLAVWSEEDVIVGRFIGDDGTAGERLTIAPLAFRTPPYVVFDGTHYLVAWMASNRIVGARLTADGQVVEVKELARTEGSYADFELVSLPSGFAIVTIRVTNGTEYTVEALRLTTAAEPYAYSWLDHTTSAQLRSLVVLADGDVLVAAWGSTSGTFLAREHQPLRKLGSAGTPQEIVKIGGTVHLLALQPPGNEVVLVSEDGSEVRSLEGGFRSTRFTSVAAASFGDRALVATTKHDEINVLPPTDENVRMHLVDELQQPVLPSELLATEPSLQMNPAIARRTSEESLAVWTETGTDRPGAIVAVRVDNAGRALGTPLAVTPTVSRNARAQVASDGVGYLIVWGDFWGNPFTTVARANAIRADGTVSPNAYLGGIRAIDVCVAWNGTDYLVGQIVATEPGHFPPTAVQVTRVSPDGVPGEVLRVSGVGQHSSVSCAAAGDKTLVAWNDQGTISGTIVSAGGTVTGEIFIDVGTGVGNVASNGEGFAVAYDVALGVEWALLTAEGTVTRFGEKRFPGSHARIAASRDGWVLAREIGGNLDATPLDRDGNRTGPPSAISDSPMRYEGVALAGGDVPIAIYMRELETPLLSRWRVFTRTITGSNPRRRAARH